MNETLEIGAPGIDAGAIVDEIRATVERKRAEGAYADPRVARAEKSNLTNLQNDDDFFDFYMSCLRQAFVVDINDFAIVERRARLGKPLVVLKTLIWKLLKFYTYRLWTQQNQINGLLLSALESAEQKNRQRIKSLETRLAHLESEQH
ncbi:MAG: hypothetical protein HN919_07445 [Verrucomicrobia bacterium]|jgi:hypothetical protein|nr:hypothetical protein [Verrucomicrobiota bacterium]MBT7066121.1 hypothetical protein [Verrucomicrobiota bacterium]MBT7700758.1 hypothetical protein [Verrucomicrobiota bacterium]